jgi:hypothetical protein
MLRDCAPCLRLRCPSSKITPCGSARPSDWRLVRESTVKAKRRGEVDILTVLFPVRKGERRQCPDRREESSVAAAG